MFRRYFQRVVSKRGVDAGGECGGSLCRGTGKHEPSMVKDTEAERLHLQPQRHSWDLVLVSPDGSERKKERELTR